MPTDTLPDASPPTTLGGVGKKPMVKRTVYVPLSLWDSAKALAEADPDPEGKNISDIVRELLEDYVKSGGKR